MLEFPVILDRESNKPLYLQLYEHIKAEIVSGKLDENRKLPSTRKLSTSLGVSRTTVESAYSQLIAEGYITSFPQKGMYPAKLKSPFLKESSTTPKTVENAVGKPAPPAVKEIKFIPGRVSYGHFPTKEWMRLTNSIFKSEPKFIHYAARQGETALRSEIAKYLYYARGVQCSPEQIVIGSGILYLLQLLVQVVEGKDVAVENPGSDGVRDLFINNGFEIYPVAVGNEGLSIASLRKTKTRLVFTTPSHQFPLGVIMPIDKRMELIEWAAANNGFIIEDDYDSEFKYDSQPIPALASLSKDHVIYMGTFSKSLLPTIRVSYMVLPERLVPIYNQKFSLYEQTSSVIHQLTLAEFMKSGAYERHLKKMRKVYRNRRQILAHAIKKHLGNAAAIHGEEAGLHLLLEVHLGFSESELIERAIKKGTHVYAASPLWAGDVPDNPFLLLGYGNVADEDLESGVKRLAEAWRTEL